MVIYDQDTSKALLGRSLLKATGLTPNHELSKVQNNISSKAKQQLSKGQANLKGLNYGETVERDCAENLNAPPAIAVANLEASDIGMDIFLAGQSLNLKRLDKH